MTTIVAGLLSAATAVGIAILVVLAQLLFYFVRRFTKPSIRFHKLPDDRTKDVTFLIRNLDAVRYQEGLRVKLEPLEAIAHVSVHAGPWCPSAPLEDKERKCVAIAFTKVPADATFSIKVKRTRPLQAVKIYLDEKSRIRPRNFNTPLPPLHGIGRLLYFWDRFLIGIVGFIAVFLLGLYVEGEGLEWTDWAFLGASVPLALAVFVLVVPSRGKSTIAGYLGWSGASKDWPAAIAPPQTADPRDAVGDDERCDVLIVVALGEEQNPFTDRVKSLTLFTQPIPHWRGTLQTHTGHLRSVCVVLQTEMGGVEAAALTTRAIGILRPTAVLMSGIMGGFQEKGVALGDVVIASRSIDYAFGKVKTREGANGPVDEMTRDPRHVVVDGELARKLVSWVASDQRNEVSTTLLQIRQRVLGDNHTAVSARFGSRVHFQPIASGPLVVASKNVIGEIMQVHRGIVGVEMEINGMMHAARASGLRSYLGIKAVSDLADPNKDIPVGADGAHARKFAAHASAHVCCRLIEDEIVP